MSQGIASLTTIEMDAERREASAPSTSRAENILLPHRSSLESSKTDLEMDAVILCGGAVGGTYVPGLRAAVEASVARTFGKNSVGLWVDAPTQCVREGSQAAAANNIRYFNLNGSIFIAYA